MKHKEELIWIYKSEDCALKYVHPYCTMPIFFVKTPQELKKFCVPGYNCRYCVGAVAGCPVATMSNFFGHGLKAGLYSVPFYVMVTFLLISLMLARIICGWLCPMGLIQDLLYKIPTPKLPKSVWTRRLSYLKYVVLVIFVIAIPIYMVNVQGSGAHYLCRNFCVVTLPAAVSGLAKAKASLLNTPRVLLGILVFGSSIFIYRTFCRFLCPLGAWYSLFNKISAYAIKVDEKQCIYCNKCIRTCLMDCEKVGDRECIACGKCLPGCPTKAISYGWRYKRQGATLREMKE